MPLQLVLDKRYVYYFLKSKSKWFLNEASKGIGQPSLNTDIIKETLFPLPPKEEQPSIFKNIKRLMEKTKLLEQEIKTSEAHAQMLMQAVLKEAFETS